VSATNKAGSPPGKSTPRLFVSGLGLVSPAGLGIEGFADAFFDPDLLAQESTHGIPELLKVPQFDISWFVGYRKPHLDASLKYALAAASLALKNGGLGAKATDPPRSGLATAMASHNEGSQLVFQTAREHKGLRPAPSPLSPHHRPDGGNGLISEEFALHGYNRHFCGDALSGARALEAAYLALRCGQATMMLTGGYDALSQQPQPAQNGEEHPGQALFIPAEGAAFLMLENEQALDQRDGNPYCELASVVCVDVAGGPIPPRKRSAAPATALKRAVEMSLEQAGIWEGDVGAVLRVARHACPDALEAQQEVLDEFRHVPTTSVAARVGSTHAASFPMECIAAALVLIEGGLPAGMTFQGVKRGVELWAERPQQLLGEAALIIGCTSNTAAAAVMLSC